MASKKRPLWGMLPPPVRSRIEYVVGGVVVAAHSCPGGFSPGFASRLTLADGRRVFVKAMDVDTWPEQAIPYRVEAQVTAGLPDTVPAPRLLASFDDGHWVILVFTDIDGAEPLQPWDRTELARVTNTIGQLSATVNPSPLTLPHDHPRLGGWSALARDPARLARLSAQSPWAAEHLSRLTALEHEGLAAAQGDTLVHFDLYPHNIVLTQEQVYFVDWPHARLGAVFLDLILVLSSAAADGLDPEPILRDHPLTAPVERRTIDAVLAAHAGFCVAGSLDLAPPGLQPIVDAKAHLARGTTTWLRGRISHRG